MRNFSVAVTCLVLLPVTSLYAAQPDGSGAIRATSTGPVQISVDGERASFIRADGDLLPDVAAGDAKTKSAVFFERHGQVLGLGMGSQLQQLEERADDWGNRVVRFEQRHNGVPVFGAWARANLDNRGRLRAVNGDLVDDIAVSTKPAVDQAVAASAAVYNVASQRPLKNLAAATADLYVYRLGGTSNKDGRPMLAWRVEVGNGRDVRQIVFVDAHSGKVVDQYNGIQEAIDRQVYNGGYGASFLVWSEGDSTPYGVAAIDDLIDYSADTYNLFKNLTGGSYLSWTGNDATMHAVNNDPGISCPNANWNGVSINFCDGTTSDDVVAHEWAHAYTQATHGLIYRWQSGALNESYSDIFGEVVDLLNLDGNDAGQSLRSVGQCSTSGGSLPPTMTVSTPAELAGTYTTGSASFNPSSANVAGNLILVNDGIGSVTDGCEAIGTNLAGAIALIDRGSCNFTQKVLNAQSVGAVGVVIANNEPTGVITMGGSAPGITIPSVMVSYDDGQALRNAGSAVQVSIQYGGTSENSIRWLMGEDAFAFGGAIRDMWEPRCMGDPGRVSDAEYHCNGNVDNGGVHINSGVPNHAFAMLVDGATFNGVTIDAIGADKAAHIYWRAATNYQGPSSDFADHADALEASCADLQGLPLPLLSTETSGTLGTTTITAGDCIAVANAMLATEMRDDPVACNFQPILDQSPPALCTQGSVSPMFVEDFESGLPGWTVGKRALANAATFDGPDWTTTLNLPEQWPGRAAYGANLVLGNCANDTEAGVIYLESPAISIDTDEAKLAFNHNVATEAQYDGGNVKISVNGGPWTLVPAAAFTYNSYNGTLVTSDNPMAGEAAFNGTDDGSLSSIWGQSQVNLTGIAAAGDVVHLRFEVGMDGCNGVEGWYVDDVTVYSCATAVDSDSDGVSDASDNCTLVANPNQRDTDGDGFGNFCDADLNNNGQVEFGDLVLIKASFFATPASPAWNPDADLNGDNAINFLDLQIMKNTFFAAPGPAGPLP